MLHVRRKAALPNSSLSTGVLSIQLGPPTEFEAFDAATVFAPLMAKTPQVAKVAFDAFNMSATISISLFFAHSFPLRKFKLNLFMNSFISENATFSAVSSSTGHIDVDISMMSFYSGYLGLSSAQC